MSFAIVRVQKFKAQAVRGIQIHDRRERDKSNTNPDIDFGRSRENYALRDDGGRTFAAAVDGRIAGLGMKKAVRKDAVVMAQIMVTSDNAFMKSLTAAEQRRFFEDSLAFIERKYGAENVISANVHMDEMTPHLHVNIVPVAGGRLSAKELFSEGSGEKLGTKLRALQDEFHAQVGEPWGLERGKEGSKRRHYETAEFKQLRDELGELTRQRDGLVAAVSVLEGEIAAIREQTVPQLRKEVNELSSRKSVIELQIEHKASERAGMEGAVFTLGEEKKRLEGEIRGQKAQINENARAIAEDEAKLKRLDIDIGEAGEQYLELRGGMEELEAERGELVANIGRLGSELDARLRRLHAYCGEMENLKCEVEALEARKESAGLYDRLVQRLRAVLAMVTQMPDFIRRAFDNILADRDPFPDERPTHAGHGLGERVGEELSSGRRLAEQGRAKREARNSKLDYVESIGERDGGRDDVPSHDYGPEL